MKLKQYLISIADGFFQGFCVIKLLLDYFLSQMAIGASLQTDIAISCSVALITSIFYYLLTCKERKNKNVLLLSAISSFVFVASVPLLVLLPLHIFPQRELDTVEGFLIMSIFLFYFLIGIVVRLGIFVGIFIRNKKNT